MFGISGFKLLIILVAVLVLVGPDKLPEIGRTIAKAIAMFKRAQEDMQSVINAEMFTGEAPKESVQPDDAATTAATQLYSVADEEEEEEDEE